MIVLRVSARQLHVVEKKMRLYPPLPGIRTKTHRF
jgi:hypothetical protein